MTVEAQRLSGWPVGVGRLYDAARSTKANLEDSAIGVFRPPLSAFYPASLEVPEFSEP